MKTKTLKGKSSQTITTELKKVLDDAQQQDGQAFKPTLAIVFMSFKQDIDAVCHLLDQKGIQIFGATTAGEFIDGDIEEGSIVIMLIEMNLAHFKLEFLETSEKTAFDDAKKAGVITATTFNNPAVIIATGGIFIDGDKIIEGIIEGYEKSTSSKNDELTVFGGMAGDDLVAEKPEVFTNGERKDNALIALIIDKDKIDVRGIASCGWNAVGTAKTVTKSEGNIVYSIDDKPALDMLMKYLGVELVKDEKKEIVSFLNAWYYPLQLDRPNGDYVIRATRFANSKERSLICTGSVPQGSKVKFSLPPDFDAIETVVSECESIKDNSQQNADALIMFSCVSRHLSFGALINEEIEKVRNVWKAPLVGFFTYGEYGKSKIGKNEFHNNACCVVALKEK